MVANANKQSQVQPCFDAAGSLEAPEFEAFLDEYGRKSVFFYTTLSV